ncbi:MAG: shikimate dehydrogenase, partial [Alphaproteobacteria bacterium]|nr:shikimate dehydrogenase [Alphaproteobacteria bacterium]
CLMINADRKLIATNTDVDGVSAALNSRKLSSGKVCIIGAGGAARAAFFTLAQIPGIEAHVLARNPEKARNVTRLAGLAAECVPLHPESGVLAGASLLINATQLGMTGQPDMPDFILNEVAAMEPDALIFDMVYQPLETQLLYTARASGRKTADGLTMLIGQAATAYEKFFGMPAPRQHDAALRALLLR